MGLLFMFQGLATMQNVNVAYRPDYIPDRSFNALIESIKAMSGSDIMWYGTLLLTFIVLLCVLVKRDKHLPKSETVLYIRGHPSLYKWTEGIIEVTADSVIFKEFAGDKIFFLIPTRQITNAIARYKTMSEFKYWLLGVFGLIYERRELVVQFRQGKKEHSCLFRTNRESLITEKLEKQILGVINPLKP
jgi:hypothetical protein